MRKIEQAMIEAIRDNVTDKRIGSNTRVHAIVGGHEVQLHGHIIAHVDASRGTVRFTLAGWPTPTTRSRINALLREFTVGGAYVCQRQHAQCFYPSRFPGEAGRAIDSREWVQA